MTAPDPTAISPVRRTVSVPWDAETAFHRFTREFAVWWPRRSHSIGGGLVERILFECHVGGRIIEELRDGRRFQWGTVTAFEPSTRVAFTWHPSLPPDQAQDVEVRFTPDGTGTQVELVAAGWERLGARAGKMRKGYDIGWGSVIDTYSERWSAVMPLFRLIGGAQRTWLRLTGKLEAEINASGGRLPDRGASPAP